VSLLFLFIFSVVLPERAMAYNEDGRFHFEANFEVLDRDIEQESTTFRGINFPGGTFSVQSLRLLAKLSVRVVEPIELYGLVGGSDLEIDDTNTDFSSDFTGAYGGGARVVFYREKDPRMPYQIFAEYRFLTFKPSDTIHFLPQVVCDTSLPASICDVNGDGVIDVGEIATLADEIVRERIRWIEHTVKIGIMGRHYEFAPYGGIRFSFVKGKDRIPTSFEKIDLNLKQDDTFGIFLGTDYYLSPSDRAALFIEGSLFDQYSLTGGIRVGF
jgi:hypothetical protein